MIFDKKGKICGKLSIVDLIIIILLLGIIFGCFIRFRGGFSEETKVSDVSVKYEVEVKGIRKYSVDAIKKSLNENVYSKVSSDVNIGKITKIVSVEPAYDYLVLDNGTIKKSDIPEKYNIVFEIECNAKLSGDSYFTDENFEIATGKVATVKTKFAETEVRFGKITRK